MHISYGKCKLIKNNIKNVARNKKVLAINKCKIILYLRSIL